MSRILTRYQQAGSVRDAALRHGYCHESPMFPPGHDPEYDRAFGVGKRLAQWERATGDGRETKGVAS